MAKDTLTPMQLRFVQAYARLGDAAAAARAAGYRGAGSGARLLQCKPVLRAIEAQRSDRVASAQEVLEYLTDVLRGEGGGATGQAAGHLQRGAGDSGPAGDHRRHPAARARWIAGCGWGR